jgi:hypothetical protein
MPLVVFAGKERHEQLAQQNAEGEAPLVCAVVTENFE